MTARLTRAEEEALDAELLGMLTERGPSTLAALFGGMEPTWAVNALDRLEIRGDVREVEGKLVVTARGFGRVAG